MKTKAEHSIIADAIHEWHTVYLPCIRNLSHNALKSYGEGMGIYIDFLESSKGVTSNTICGECFRKDWIEEWIAWLKEVRKCSPQTCNHRLSILKNFLRFLAHKKIQFIKYDCDAAEIKRMQQPKKQVEVITKDTIKRIFASINTRTLIGKRDFALFNLLYSTGTRIDEILSLRLSALHLDETKSYILVLGKGNKQRTIYLLNSMVKILKHYVKLFHPANPLPSDFVFFPIYGHANKKITSEAISKRLKMYVRIAPQGLLEIPADFHCHSFRHARATQCHHSLSEVIITENIHERKQKMAQMADAFVALPGGCGTFEELLEVITWKQLGLHTKPIIILNTKQYYNPLIEMLNKAVEEKFMKQSHSQLWTVASTPEEVLLIVDEIPETVAEQKY